MRPSYEQTNLKAIHQLPRWLNISLPIGDQVRGVREALGMTQTQLARRSGLAQSVIAEIEAGKRADLCLSTIKRLAAGLNCETLVQIIPEKNVAQLLDEQSTKIAKMIVATSSGSAAIELQLPEQNVIDEQVNQIKRDLLKKHRSALWRQL